MVPLRAIFEALGATVDWNDATQTVTSTKGNTTISLTINNPTMYVNGTSVALDSPACLVGARTLVPVRAISEAFGTKSYFLNLFIHSKISSYFISPEATDKPKSTTSSFVQFIFMPSASKKVSIT